MSRYTYPLFLTKVWIYWTLQVTCEISHLKIYRCAFMILSAYINLNQFTRTSVFIMIHCRPSLLGNFEIKVHTKCLILILRKIWHLLALCAYTEEGYWECQFAILNITEGGTIKRHRDTFNTRKFTKWNLRRIISLRKQFKHLVLRKCPPFSYKPQKDEEEVCCNLLTRR